MIQHFAKDILVNQFECDFCNRMKLSSILRQAEQISIDNCTAIGIDDCLYQKTHTAFLLAKLVVEINEDISVGDVVHLVTTAALPVKAVYNRYTSFSVDGNEKVGIDTRWILVDTENKRILRKPPEEFKLPFFNETEKTLDLSMEKGNNISLLDEVIAQYSSVDRNGHLNNAEYADIICNHLSVDLLREKSVRKLVIYYHHELLMGKSMKLYYQENDDGSLYFTGVRKDGKSCFEAEITLK